MSTDMGAERVTQVIAPVQFTLEPEPVGFLDLSYSTYKNVKRGSPKTRNDVIEATYKIFVNVLQRYDAAAKDAAAAGEAEEEGGGVLTYVISGEAAHPLEDVNSENFAEKVTPWEPNDSTYAMQNIRAWEADACEEFQADKVHDIQRTFCLTFLMDGDLNDRLDRKSLDPAGIGFETWAAQQPENVLIFIALVGEGDDTIAADAAYMQLAQTHKNIKAVSFMGEDDPMVIARTMLQFFNLKPIASDAL